MLSLVGLFAQSKCSPHFFLSTQPLMGIDCSLHFMNENTKAGRLQP